MREQRVRSAHRDTFVRDHLPAPDLWPKLEFNLPELKYPKQLNCAVELLDKNIQRGLGSHVAFYFPGGHCTYAELLELSNSIANMLIGSYGLVPGQRVLLRGPNNLMMAACWFAVLKAGGIVVCTMPLLRERELRFIIGHARVNLALTDDRHADELVRAAGQTSVIRFSQLQAVGASSAFANVPTAADDVAIVAYTSGTTGEAKGTVHFHRDMIACCDCWPAYVLRANRDDIFSGSPPFAFTFGLGGLVLFPMRIGAASVLLEQTAPPQLLAAIQEFRPTILFTSPTAYRAMLGKLPESDVSSLQKCVSAGEPLPLATFEAWQAATGLKIIDGIGATEMLHIFISSSGEDIRPGSTGKVVPGYSARVVDDHMRDVRTGDIGKLAVRGPTGCRYLANEERQRVYVRDGWNLTGDAYRVDADGYFWYQARADDMIISSGYNISGPEVENVLLEHPAVLECGVVGVPHEERGQIVKAFIVLKPSAMPSEELVLELQEHVKQQIAPYKYPRAIEFCESLPRTNTGKLQRFKLRELAG